MLELRRLESIDLMRGLVIILMALDHTRDFLSNALIDPTDLNKTSTGLFLTRWITHLCAPTFVFLTGAGAYLSMRRRHLSKHQLAIYLLTRGLWLIVLEFTLVRFGWTFNWNYHAVLAQVIWVLGCSMIILAGLIYWPRWAIALFAVITIAGHNLLDGIQPKDMTSLGWLWHILHVKGRIEYLPGFIFYVSYPLIPWLGVMAGGYCLGALFPQTPAVRQRLMLYFGVSFILLFMVLRLTNVYGDPDPWLMQKNPLFTFFAILNCEKYPPSLLYLLITLGLMWLCLALFECQRWSRYYRVLLVFGKVPLLFYLLHLPVIHSVAMVLTYLRGLPIDWLAGSTRPFPRMPSADYGYDLVTVYGIWLFILILLYPICLAYADFKRQHPNLVWLSYL